LCVVEGGSVTGVERKI
jgi:hypothetical protein